MRSGLFKFACVGAAGFAVDIGGLYLLTAQGGDPMVLRLVTFLMAVAVTWVGNRYWTFADQARGGAAESFLPYLGVQSIGLIVNYATFATLLGFVPATPAFAALAAGIGSIVAILITYLGTALIVFGDRQASRPTR